MRIVPAKVFRAYIFIIIMLLGALAGLLHVVKPEFLPWVIGFALIPLGAAIYICTLIPDFDK